MENKFFEELSRRLREGGIESSNVEDKRLEVFLHGRPVLFVSPGHDAFLLPAGSQNQKASELYHRVAGMADEVYEYVEAVQNAPLLRASSLKDEFHLLADFGGAVLAGIELPKEWGYQFNTWIWNYDRTALLYGHNYMGDFQSAKQDFAVRSGLISKAQLFSPEELTELYRDLILECFGHIPHAGLRKRIQAVEHWDGPDQVILRTVFVQLKSRFADRAWDGTPPGYLAALYLLASKERLWQPALSALSHDFIDFNRIALHGFTAQDYPVFYSARRLYDLKPPMEVEDLAHRNLVSDMDFLNIIYATLIARHGKAVMDAGKEAQNGLCNPSGAEQRPAPGIWADYDSIPHSQGGIRPHDRTAGAIGNRRHAPSGLPSG